MKPGPALSQKLGPLGIPVNNVIQKVNEATKSFSGIQVPVELNVNPSTKEFEVIVFSPPTSGLIKKELGINKGSGVQKKFYVGNASIEQIISLAKSKSQNLLCKDLKSAVKTIVGTCVSLGILIENKPAVEIEREIEAGKYDKEIKAEKTETSATKKKEIEEYFSKVKKEQDKLIKQEQAAKETAEAEKKEAAATTPSAATPTAAAPAAKAPAKAAAKKK
jgi:large subunit ribosomal protein L11